MKRQQPRKTRTDMRGLRGYFLEKPIASRKTL